MNKGRKKPPQKTRYGNLVDVLECSWPSTVKQEKEQRPRTMGIKNHFPMSLKCKKYLEKNKRAINKSFYM